MHHSNHFDVIKRKTLIVIRIKLFSVRTPHTKVVKHPVWKERLVPAWKEVGIGFKRPPILPVVKKWPNVCVCVCVLLAKLKKTSIKLKWIVIWRHGSYLSGFHYVCWCLWHIRSFLFMIAVNSIFILFCMVIACKQHFFSSYIFFPIG